jgi:NAD+ synthase
MTDYYIHRYLSTRTKAFREQYRGNSVSLLSIDDTEAVRLVEEISKFYRQHLKATSLDGYVVGLSGGVDSSLVATLLVDAVGVEKVHGLIMPAEHSRQRDVDDALELADDLGISTNDPERFGERIDGVVDELEGLGEESEHQQVKRGNILARCRMIVIRDVARAKNALVAGTTNASERDLGYMTLAADGRGGVDNEALYQIYKTTERQLARFVDVPERIITKNPTADLWEGQQDKEELGYGYELLDKVLVGLRLKLRSKEVAEHVEGISREEVSDIESRIARNSFKRRLAPHPSFS